MVLLKQQQKIHGSTVTFSLTGLSNYTTYYFKVDVSDEKGGSATGTETSAMTLCSATYCSGKRTTTKTCTASGCSNGAITSTCSVSGCDDGTITTECPVEGCNNGGVLCCEAGVPSVTRKGTGTESGSCSSCGTRWRGSYYTHMVSWPCGTFEYRYTFCSSSCAGSYGDLSTPGGWHTVNCDSCGADGYVESSCGACGGDGSTESGCSTCGGDGKVTSYTNCGHGNSSSHYVCSAHGYNGSTSSHS